jgi:membrane associated rhomboid family serine protease
MASQLGLDQVLALIGKSAPQPWYPGEFTRQTEVDRPSLERALDALRMARLIELTPWESGHGQGLALTSNGRKILHSPKLMFRLARGELPRHDVGGPDPPQGLEVGTTFARGEAIRNALLTQITPRATQVLLAINVIVFAIGQVIAFRGQNQGFIQFGGNDALIRTGAVNGELLLKGEWWRLLTACFVHIGALHLFMNMYALWILGPIHERLWGRARYLCVYLLSGFVGSCAAMWRHPEATVAGASGCIWGLFAAQLVWITLNRSFLPRELVSNWTRGLLTTIALNAVISFMPGISAEGHFGGGAAGAIIAALLIVHQFGRGALRWLSLAVVAFVPIASVGVVIWAKDHTLNWHKVVRAFNEHPENRRPPADQDNDQ